MAIYTIDYTSTTTMLASIKAGLTSAGILTTTHRDTSVNLIVTTTYSSRVVRFNATSNNRIYIYYGTGYTSGDVVDNSVSLQTVGSGIGASAALIVTGDMFGLFEYRGSSITVGFICGHLDNLAETEIMWGFSTGATSPLLHDATAMVQMEAAFYSREIISAADKYYASAIPCMTATRLLLAQGIVGVYALHKTANTGAPYEIIGDDVVVPGGGANSSATYMLGMSLYIPQGNSWTPA